MGHVMTVHGPIDPSALGFTLPHEHTQIQLWQIPGRWDYWELTRDEPVILEELRRYREAGGAALVGRALDGGGRVRARRRDHRRRRARPGVAPDARRPERAAGRDGLWLVPRRVLPGRPPR